MVHSHYYLYWMVSQMGYVIGMSLVLLNEILRNFIDEHRIPYTNTFDKEIPLTTEEIFAKDEEDRKKVEEHCIHTKEMYEKDEYQCGAYMPMISVHEFDTKPNPNYRDNIFNPLKRKFWYVFGEMKIS